MIQTNVIVLNVDDRPEQLYVKTRDLQSAGFAVVESSTGADALRRISEQRPTVVLLDGQLPDIDGDEVFRRLRRDAATAQIPCIALSANAMSNDIEAARSMGFNDYWTKPIDVAAFLSDIDAFFDL